MKEEKKCLRLLLLASNKQFFSERKCVVEYTRVYRAAYRKGLVRCMARLIIGANNPYNSLKFINGRHPLIIIALLPINMTEL